MDILFRLFDGLDGRILNFDFSKIISKNYLFDSNPDAFNYRTWAFIVYVVFIVGSALALYYFKKPRKRFAKSTRFELKRLAKINIVLAIILFVSFFFRTQGVEFLGWRLWQYIALLGLVVNILYSLFVILINHRRIGPGNSESENTYQKYLPKKKKKKN